MHISGAVRVRSWINGPADGFSVLIVLTAALAATWIGAHGFPSGNNVYHLPVVLDYAGSAEGPHDAYHQSFANFISYFWQGVALFTTEANMRVVFLGLLLLGSMATVLGGYALAVAAGAPRGIAAIGTGVLAFAFAGRQIMEFGGGELLSGFLTHSQFATAVCLLAAALAVRRQWIWASVACGCAADLSLFLGFWLMCNLLLARLAVGWRSESRLCWAECMKMAGACLVAAAPVIVWALATIGPTVSTDFSFTAFLYQTFPYHSFVHLELWTGIAFLALLVTVWFGLSGTGSEAGWNLAMLVASGGVTILLGAVAVYLFDERLIQNLYPLRYAALVHWLAAIGVVVLWGRAVKAGTGTAAYAAIGTLGFALANPAVTLFGLAFLMDRGAAPSRLRWVALLGLAGCLIVPAFSTGRVELPATPWLGPLPAVTLICVVGAALLTLCPQKFTFHRWSSTVLLWLVASTTLVGAKSFAVVFAVAVVALTLMMLQGANRRLVTAAILATAIAMVVYVEMRSEFDKTVLGSLILALITCFVGARLSAWRGQQTSRAVLALSVALLSVVGIARGAAHGFDFPTYPKDQNWLAAQQWARQNTPPDTQFYAPGRPGFATLARRPLWWDHNEFPAVMWSPSFYKEWNSRRALAAAVQTPDELLSLARKERIGFLVLEKGQVEAHRKPGVDVQYCNPDYCILAVGMRQAAISVTGNASKSQ